MTSLGIAVAMATRPVARCVLATGSRVEPALYEAFDLKTASDDVASQAEDLARQLSSRLGAVAIDAAVICVADFSPAASRAIGRRNRLLVEGALVYACKSNTQSVLVRTGKDIGTSQGISKSAGQARGRLVDPARVEAAAAAVSGLPSA